MDVGALFMLASVPFSVGSMFMGHNFAVRIPMVMTAVILWVIGMMIYVS